MFNSFDQRAEIVEHAAQGTAAATKLSVVWPSSQQFQRPQTLRWFDMFNLIA